MQVIATLVLLGGAAVMLLLSKKQLRGTTLVAPWWWAMASLLALAWYALTHSFESRPAPLWSHWNYAAAVTTFAPLMAVLGARRPQDRAWQFIVFALLVVLWLPALTAAAYRPRRLLDLAEAYRWLVLLLVFIGLMNGIFTRHRLAVLLVTVGQALLLGDQLPSSIARGMDWLARGGLDKSWGAAFLAAGVIVWAFERRRKVTGQSFDRLWADFRDLFGAAWALRFAERFNAAASLYHWDAFLSWRGLSQPSTGYKRLPEITPAMRRTLRGLLRRFVSQEWIAARWSDF